MTSFNLNTVSSPSFQQCILARVINKMINSNRQNSTPSKNINPICINPQYGNGLSQIVCGKVNRKANFCTLVVRHNNRQLRTAPHASYPCVQLPWFRWMNARRYIFAFLTLIIQSQGAHLDRWSCLSALQSQSNRHSRAGITNTRAYAYLFAYIFFRCCFVIFSQSSLMMRYICDALRMWSLNKIRIT